ncbi:MAG TPA: RsmE family RNA methyltransferase [Thermoanaerobaculia bacterium]|nr:RsmE family RNA methyltransferase [Thermoanaerobaculia bacterium]
MLHRFHFPFPMLPGATARLAGEEFHPAARVRRLGEGEEIELFDGSGTNALAVVRRIGRDELEAEILSTGLSDREPRIEVTLAIPLIQPDRFELVLQKATELGISGFIPLLTDRTEVRPERMRGKKNRWERIILEAVKQSGRARVPRLEEESSLDQILGRAGTHVLFDADADPESAFRVEPQSTLLVGPEGGWSGRELDLARETGCTFVRLGPRRLRAETACIAAAVLASEIGNR